MIIFICLLVFLFLKAAIDNHQDNLIKKEGVRIAIAEIHGKVDAGYKE